MNGPWDFWNAYYRWAIMTPLNRSMRRMSVSIQEVQITLLDHFTPVMRKVARAFQDFSFDLWLVRQPRWQRPLVRLAYRIERLVLP